MNQSLDRPQPRPLQVNDTKGGGLTLRPLSLSLASQAVPLKRRCEVCCGNHFSFVVQAKQWVVTSDYLAGIRAVHCNRNIAGAPMCTDRSSFLFGSILCASFFFVS